MASYGHTFTSGDTVTPTKLNNARTVSDIVNADIKSDAAIAGTKIAPSFGAQDITVGSGNRSITNTTNHALAFGTNNAERMRIANNGQVIIGHNAPLSLTGSAGFEGLQMHSLGTLASTTMSRWNNDTSPIFLSFVKSRSGAVGSIGGAVPSGNTIASLFWLADDGTNITSAASISAAVDGTPGTNDMPGRLVFSTTADGGSSPTERMRIDSAGNVGIGATSISNTRMRIDGTITGAGSTSAHGIYVRVAASSGVSNIAHGYTTNLLTASNGGSPYTINGIFHFEASQNTFDADSTVTNQVGFHADSGLVGATNNFGFYSELAAASGRWNFYAAGTAQNYFAGTVAIGTTSPNAAALLDVSSTTKGFLPPRMTTAQRDAISTPPAGLVIYNTSTNVLNFYNGSAWGAV